MRRRSPNTIRPFLVDGLEDRMLLSSNMPMKLPDLRSLRTIGCAVSSQATVVITALAPARQAPRQTSLDIAPSGGASRIPLPGDSNGDGIVNLFDLNTLSANMGAINATWQMGDFTGDGTVDVFDINVLASHWLQTAPPQVLYDWHQQVIDSVLNVWAPNPLDFGTTRTVTDPRELFGPDGVPNLDGVHQGTYADCYFLAAIGSLAQDRPAHIMQKVTEDSTGGWQVTFQWRNPATGIRQPVIIHTSREVSLTCQVEANQEVWPLVMEKAFAAARTFNGLTATNTMASIAWGYAGDAMKFLGEPFTPIYTTGETDTWEFEQMAAARTAVLPVLFHTSGTATTMVSSHVYVITRVFMDTSGTQQVTTYNPWGFYETRTITDVMRSSAGVLVIANA